MKWVFDDSNDSFYINIGTFTSPRGILLDDITDVMYSVKNNIGDPDSSAVVTRTLGSGIAKVSGDSELSGKIQVKFSPNDFGSGKLEIGRRYHAGLGIKTAAMTRFLELRLLDNKLCILPDFIHD